MTNVRKLINALNPQLREFVLSRIHLDLGTALGLAPELVRLITLIIRAKKGKGDGGSKITPDERDEILEAVEDLLHDAVAE